MIKQIKRIIILCIVFLYIMLLKSYAGYTYENEMSFFRLNRNITKPNYTTTYEKNTWTKEDVLITIKSDKILEILNGDFSLSNDGKTLTKTVSENEKGTIKIRDEDYNYDEIEYEVSWIDKEPPKIIGANNNGIYNKNLHLEYTDNGEIDEIYVDKYQNRFILYIPEMFIDEGSIRFLPITKNSITAWVEEHIRGMEKYKYYLNNQLYATTNETKYTFKNLEEMKTGYQIKVEGLDRNNKVIGTQEYTMKTAAFDEAILEKTDTTETVKFVGISDKITRVAYFTWIDGAYDSTLKYKEVNVQNKEAVCSLNIADFGNRKEKYIMHVYFYYNENGTEKSSIYGGNIDMSKPYTPPETNPSINDFNVNGNYYVRVKDKAGNESEIDFTIQK